MLGLTRKRGEAIIIDNNIQIVVLDIDGKSVRLGVNAPDSVPVYREELYLQIQEANAQASGFDATEELKKRLEDREQRRIESARTKLNSNREKAAHKERERLESAGLIKHSSNSSNSTME